MMQLKILAASSHMLGKVELLEALAPLNRGLVGNNNAGVSI